MSKTKIEWARTQNADGTTKQGQTWNPLIGCDKVSAGCRKCYAIKQSWIHMSHPNPAIQKKYEGTVKKTPAGELNWTGRVNMSDETLLQPLKNKIPTTYFVNSLSDLFHEAVPFGFIDQVFAVMGLTPQHTYQILTKREDRMLEYYQRFADDDLMPIEEAADIIVCGDPHLFSVVKKLPSRYPLITNEFLPHIKQAGWFRDTIYSEFGNDVSLVYEGTWPFPNVWQGVSVENQEAFDKRVPKLIQTKAAVRFLSCEPLLGPLDLKLEERWCTIPDMDTHDECEIKSDHIDWVICGGESGSDARPMHPDWARALRDQCKSAGIPFFFKQWGEYADGSDYTSSAQYFAVLDNGQTFPAEGIFEQYGYTSDSWQKMHPTIMRKVGKKKAGNLLDGVVHQEMPNVLEQHPVHPEATK